MTACLLPRMLKPFQYWTHYEKKEFTTRGGGPGCSKLMTSLVKISNINVSNMPIFFVEKNEKSFCSAKAFLIFFNKKYSCIWL